MKMSLIAFLAFLGLTTASYAGIVFEPQVGYSWSKMSFNDSALEDSNLKGFNFGAKLYYDMPEWFLGLDYNYNQFDIEDLSETMKDTQIGAIAGLNLARFFRLYAGYIFSNNAKIDNVTLDGKGGFKAGLSFLALRNVAIGLEYRKIDLKKEGGLTSDPSHSGTTVLISFPFGL